MREWLHLAQAAGLVVIIRIALAVFPVRTVTGSLRRAARWLRSAHPASAAYERRVVWAVSAVARRLLPERPCLTQALAVQFLLARRGYRPTLHIGVSKEGETLAAHAWVERDGQVLIGGRASRLRYRAFPGLDEKMVQLHDDE